MKVKVTLIQDNPIFFDKEATLKKVEALTVEHAQKGSELIVFPESFVPGYPRGFIFGTKVGSRTAEGREVFAQYYDNSFNLDTDLERIENLSRENQVYIILGVTEQQSHRGTLYCSMLYISPSQGFLGVHRKIKPTGFERVIWGEAGGEGLVTFDTQIGKLGGLICWENYMPEARMAMYKKGVEIYVAPTADSRDNWTATMQHIALEGRCYVLGCNQFFTKSMYSPEQQKLAIDEPEMMCRGGSVIVGPEGKIIAGPLFDKAGALSAEIDLDAITRAKLDFDVIGHYSRDDIFNLQVKNQPEMKKE